MTEPTNTERMNDALLREIAGAERDASSVSSIIAGLSDVVARITTHIGQLMRDGEDDQAANLRDSAGYLTDAIEVLTSLQEQMSDHGF